MSTACKAPEEAWRFISSLLDEDSDEIEYFSGLPINARAYDAAEAEAADGSIEVEITEDKPEE